MSELRKTLEEEVRKIIDEPMPELPPSKLSELETEGVFDPSLLDSVGYPIPPVDFDNPMAALMQPLIQYFESIKPKYLEPVKSEHKVRIFRLPALAKPKEIAGTEREIENLLNDGYCCHIPTVCGDFVIMDFSRRKESEENEREQ